MPSFTYHATLSAMVAASGDPVNAPTIGKGKVTLMTVKRRLHVWEHPSLHPEQMGKKNVPVHVVFDHEEFDWWHIDNVTGQLRVGWTVDRHGRGEERGTVYKDNVPFYTVPNGMYAKVWLEQYEDDPEPEPKHEATETETPLFNGEDGPVYDLGLRPAVQNPNLCTCMDRYSGTDDHGNCTVCGNPAKPISETGATDPSEAREILKKKMADNEDGSPRDRFVGQPGILGLKDEPADNTAGSLMLPLPAREMALPPVSLKDGTVIKVTPPDLGETRLDLLKPIKDIQTDKSKEENN